MYGIALRIVRRHEVADDVAQEAFMRAHQALSSFDLTRPFGPWIGRIASNLAINHVRAPQAREEPLPEGHAETPAPGMGALEMVLEREAREVLERALQDLPASGGLYRSAHFRVPVLPLDAVSLDISMGP